jgi:hypothetical protein
MAGAVLAQLGCEIFHGPRITNRSAVPLNVMATFSGRAAEIQLQPGQSLLQRQRNQSLEALRVSDGVFTKAFTAAQIQNALSEAGGPDHAVIELLGEQIRGAPIRGPRK